MDLIILQYLLQRTLLQFWVFLWLVWLHARLCSCTFLGEILNESHKDDSLMFAVHSSLWIVLSIILKMSHFGPDAVVIACLYLDREGLIYRVHEWCRGCEHSSWALSRRASLSPHSASTRFCIRTEEENPDAWKLQWPDGLPVFQRSFHNDTICCVFSQSAQIWQLFSFFLILQLLWSKLKCNFQCDNSETRSCTMSRCEFTYRVWRYGILTLMHTCTLTQPAESKQCCAYLRVTVTWTT